MKDAFGREITYLRLSVTELCNLRCRYCMPAEGVCKRRHEDMLTQEEMILTIRAAAELGIRKLRITGGEPLLQADFTLALLRAAKENGISTAIETSGYGDFEAIEKIAEYTDLFLWDFKESDEKLHKEYTGVSNEKILDNLKRLENK